MRNRFDRQLVELNNELIEMGSLIEKAIEMAITALVNQDVALAQDAIDFDEEIDKQEKEIESLCMKILLSQQPVAKDLRLVSAALKMITDMERIGDHAGDISEITIFLSDKNYVMDITNLKQMAKETTVMVIKSLEAFVKRDLEMAGEVIAKDDIVDDLFIVIKKEIIRMIGTQAAEAGQAADFLMIAKYFERIGDHAVNIAEWVIFSITGKHKGEE